MQTSSNAFFTRCHRIWRLVVWLAVTAKRVYGFKNLDTATRNQRLHDIAADLLTAIHLRVEVEQPPQPPLQPPFLAVSNHVSWLDIFILMAQYPSGVIAKQAIRSWPVIGTLASHIGTVFINRDSRKDVGPVNHAIAEVLTHGQSVTFFPEARTSDGNGILPFKAALFQSAIDTAMPIQPIALRYYDDQNQRSTTPAYVGNDNLFASLWRIAGMPAIVVKVNYAPLIGGEITGQGDRFDLKSKAEQFISDVVHSDLEQPQHTDNNKE